MFQFPGFALKDLCIQSLSTWFKPLLITKGNNNDLSGGFPHSEILGSKPIPGSPKLIAGYHVFHRLLLPRHPPNALLALDLIQKERVLRLAAPEAGKKPAPLFLNQKANYPAPGHVGDQELVAHSVECAG